MSSEPVCAPDPEPSHGPAAALLKARRHCRIVHHLPGRLRLRFDPQAIAAALSGDPAGRPAESLRAELAALAGIHGTEVNLPARSVTISYDPAILPPALWEQLIRDEPAAAAAALRTLLAARSHHQAALSP